MTWFCTILISLVLSWILFHRIRSMSFVAAMDAASGELFDMASAYGRLDDPAFLKTRDMLHQFVKGRSYLSLPILLRVALGYTPGDKIVSEDPEFNEWLQALRVRISHRLSMYIVLTPFGLILGLLALCGPFRDGDRNQRMTSAAADAVAKRIQSGPLAFR